MTDEGRRPIGYWLKHLDGLIEGAFERTLAAEGVTRREWQLLNTLTTGPATHAELSAAVAPFLRDDPNGAQVAVAGLVERGWASAANKSVGITAAGADARAQLLDKVAVTRRRILDGVSGEEYATVVDVLRRMSANLERAAG